MPRSYVAARLADASLCSDELLGTPTRRTSPAEATTTFISRLFYAKPIQSGTGLCFGVDSSDGQDGQGYQQSCVNRDMRSSSAGFQILSANQPTGDKMAVQMVSFAREDRRWKAL